MKECYIIKTYFLSQKVFKSSWFVAAIITFWSITLILIKLVSLLIKIIISQASKKTLRVMLKVVISI